MNGQLLFLGANSPSASTSDWVQREFASLELHDTRRNLRFLKCFELALNNPGQSIPQMCNSWAETKAFYRLLDQEVLTADAILNAHCESSLGRALASQEPYLLAIQDTTTLNFTHRTALKEKGPICNDRGLGINLHNTLLVGAESNQVHGLLGSKIFIRENDKPKQPAKVQNRIPLEAKESVRWREGYQLAHSCHRRLCNQGPKDLIMVSVGDREADIYEVMVEAQLHCHEGMHLLVRATKDRRLHKTKNEAENETGGETPSQSERRLWKHISALPAAGTLRVQVPKGSGLKLREIELEVRYAKEPISVPRDRVKYDKATQTLTELTAIELREVNEPSGIHWKLLTTLPVESLADARRAARWYSKRWKIEVLHRVLKSGCKVEERQLQCADRQHPMIAMDLISACYLMGLCQAARTDPTQPALNWVGSEEIQTLQTYFKLPATPVEQMDVGQLVKLLARLGGHLGRKGDGPPGAEVLWRGVTKLRAITEMWEVMKANPKSD